MTPEQTKQFIQGSQWISITTDTFTTICFLMGVKMLTVALSIRPKIGQHMCKFRW